jgi:hypothetical protein
MAKATKTKKQVAKKQATPTVRNTRPAKAKDAPTLEGLQAWEVGKSIECRPDTSK